MEDILKINYEKYKLENGLEVILYQEKSLPLVAANIWYKVGSSNETKNKTGYAHLFEHMMFQGSQNIGKQLHFKYIQEAGGSLNGSTSLDRTNYYETVPSNFLELILWLESDRMGFFLPALTQDKLDNQIDVVKNERRQRYENAPYGLAHELITSNFYPENHPYSWPTIGWMRDIESMTLNDVKEFFTKFYTPNNATLVVGGDFEIDEAKDLIEKYFGEIPAGKLPEKIQVEDFILKENIYLVHKDNVQLPRIYLNWKTVNSFTENDAVLDVLSYVLSGSKTSRLYKNLVFEKELAQNITAYQYSAKLSGMFSIIATAKPRVTLDQIKDEIFLRLEEIFTNGATESEIEKAKNNAKASFIFSMQNLANLTNQLNEYNYFLNEPNSFLFDLNRYQKVTAEQVKQAALEFLQKPYLELRVVPQNSLEG